MKKKHRSVALTVASGAALVAFGFMLVSTIPELVRYLKIRRM
jgi:hypothetical protein